MDIEKKRTLFFSILLGLAVIGSVVYFVWGNFINSGTLNVIGEAPFEVEIFGISKHECLASPCPIKAKSGYKDLILRKEGYKTIVTSSSVKLWRKVDLNANFEILPQVVETDSLPEIKTPSKFSLVLDSKNNVQQLVKNDSEIIAYFPRAIDESHIIGGKNSVLVIDKNSDKGLCYIVNLLDKSREEIQNINLFNAEEGSWSDDGNYLIFNKKDDARLWLFDNNKKTVSQLALATGLQYISWANDKLAFVSGQGYSAQGEFEMNLLDTEALEGLTFGIYDPARNIYEKIGNFPQITQLPETFVVTSNGYTVYFQSGIKIFKIDLK